MSTNTTITTTPTAIRTSAVILAEITAKINEYNAEGFTGESVPEDLANLKKEYNTIIRKETFRAWAESEKPLETACKALYAPVLTTSIDKTSATIGYTVKSTVFDIRAFIDYCRANPTFREKVKYIPVTFKYDLENLAIAFDITISDSLNADLTPEEIATKHKRSKANAAKVATIIKMSKTQFRKTFTARAHDVLPDIADILPVDITFIRDGYTKHASTLGVTGTGVNVFVKLFAEVLHKHATGKAYHFDFQRAKEKAATAPASAPETNLPNSNKGIGDIVKEQADKLNNEPTTNEPTTNEPEQQ